MRRILFLAALIAVVSGMVAVPAASADDGDLAAVGFATGQNTAQTADMDDEDDRTVDEIVDDIVSEVTAIQQRKVAEAEAAMNRVLCSLGVVRYCGLSASFDETVHSFAPAGLPLAQYSCTTVSCAGYNYGYNWGHRVCYYQYGISAPRCYYA